MEMPFDIINNKIKNPKLTREIMKDIAQELKENKKALIWDRDQLMFVETFK